MQSGSRPSSHRRNSPPAGSTPSLLSICPPVAPGAFIRPSPAAGPGAARAGVATGPRDGASIAPAWAIQVRLSLEKRLDEQQNPPLIAAGGHVEVVLLLINDEDVDRDATDGAGRSALEVVQHILNDDVGGHQDYKTNLEEIRALLSQVMIASNQRLVDPINNVHWT